MKDISMEFGEETLLVSIPERCDVLSMSTPRTCDNPRQRIQTALKQSIGSPSLKEVIATTLEMNGNAKVAIVISDNTRPVPYRGDAGILTPIVQELLYQGVAKERIVILVATGTHRAVTKSELKTMLDPIIFDLGIRIKNHDCRDEKNLIYLGNTKRGTAIHINREYVEADLKILTGLVESHFMAGASGGRKSVCPGLIGELGTNIFHGAAMLSSPNTRDLVLAGNPCHEEALEVAKMAGVDYIINVTLDHQFNLTGVFAGDLEEAHQQAVEHMRQYISIPISHEYDIVVAHAGFVGINHYQAAKVGVASIPVLKRGGQLILVSNSTDENPLGSTGYRTVLHLLKIMGAAKFNKLLHSPDWCFIPEQWQVQMWSKLFSKIPHDNLIYYSPQLSEADYLSIPCTDGNKYLPASQRYHNDLSNIALVIENIFKKIDDDLTVAYLSDGPYGIPINNQLAEI